CTEHISMSLGSRLLEIRTFGQLFNALSEVSSGSPGSSYAAARRLRTFECAREHMLYGTDRREERELAMRRAGGRRTVRTTRTVAGRVAHWCEEEGNGCGRRPALRLRPFRNLPCAHRIRGKSSSVAHLPSGCRGRCLPRAGRLPHR